MEKTGAFTKTLACADPAIDGLDHTFSGTLLGE
jgi:hypothetical protein